MKKCVRLTNTFYTNFLKFSSDFYLFAFKQTLYNGFGGICKNGCENVAQIIKFVERQQPSSFGVECVARKTRNFAKACDAIENVLRVVEMHAFPSTSTISILNWQRRDGKRGREGGISPLHPNYNKCQMIFVHSRGAKACLEIVLNSLQCLYYFQFKCQFYSSIVLS